MTLLFIIDVAPIPSGGTALSILLVIVALILLFFSALALGLGLYLLARNRKARNAAATPAHPVAPTQP
jgi:hypothetical protein